MKPNRLRPPKITSTDPDMLTESTGTIHRSFFHPCSPHHALVAWPIFWAITCLGERSSSKRSICDIHTYLFVILTYSSLMLVRWYPTSHLSVTRNISSHLSNTSLTFVFQRRLRTSFYVSAQVSEPIGRSNLITVVKIWPSLGKWISHWCYRFCKAVNANRTHLCRKTLQPI